MEASRIDLRSLQVFRAVCEMGSFTKAGAQFGLTQSAVSRQIQLLEQYVGTALLNRTTRRVDPTEAGRAFLESAAHLLHDFGSHLERLRERFLDQPPKIKLGLSRTISHSHLPGLLTPLPALSLEGAGDRFLRKWVETEGATRRFRDRCGDLYRIEISSRPRLRSRL